MSSDLQSEGFVRETSRTVKGRAVDGVKSLGSWTILAQVVRLGSSLILARLLFPADYGVFGVVAYITALGMFLGDVGLSAALIRRESEPSDDERVTVFAAQQLLVATVVAVLLMAAPVLIRVYGLSADSSLLLRAMAVGLFFQSLRVLPLVQLQRGLRFGTIGGCDFLSQVIGTGVAIAIAAAKGGAWALVGSTIVQGAVGLLALSIASPWRPRGKPRLAILRRLLGFGMAFQLNALVPTLSAGWMPLIVGRLLGTSAVGLVTWASALASTPHLLGNVLNRIAFPAYSRLQTDVEMFSLYLELSIRRLGLILSLVVPLFALMAPWLIPVVFGARWESAVPLVQWFSIGFVFLTLTGILASAQNAQGFAGERLVVTIIAGSAQWGLGFAAVYTVGLGGVAATMVAVAISEMMLTAGLLARRRVLAAIALRRMFTPLAVTLTIFVIAMAVGRVLFPDDRLLQSIAGVVSFGALSLLLDLSFGRRQLSIELGAIIRMVRQS